MAVNSRDSKCPELKTLILSDFHRLMVEALRLREQEVLRYIAILAPALAGFVWLLVNQEDIEPSVFIVGTIGVMLLLGTGAVYSVALGYNFRSIILQIAKIRELTGIRKYVLKKWPGSPQDFKSKYHCMCYPPEIIGVFWISFIVFMLGVTFTVGNLCVMPTWAVIICCIIVLIAALCPLHYGQKLRKLVYGEPDWNDL